MTRVFAIAESTLKMILGVGKSAMPNEMIGLLRAEDGVINDVVFAPGTVTSEVSSMVRIDQLPVGLKTVGSVHSHPSGNPTPSGADREMFSKKGKCHIITANPFEMNDWVAYNKKSEPIELDVVELSSKKDKLWEEELERIRKEL
ncbi:Proteasome lid subunit RPN8/RPN11 containing Jab1/MPN domain [Methanonatronarchaeum thermophilum]|uniref:Proteasome lid subunit RPN8/RPN11 containing Jab1/MPN domain n=1 Tax=Methanonatronarchaeum thermophilum TaxID=1927129 RepID=A0A1Y3GC59_9EURY|nr:Mov34/MPN/PAD-1 family protein [Methanonatronarchaeum thermophilum]OUJ19052.1 Proteasome lid subunit RPN8/RPN11 containing Jab1/MPN domain [Methanonatronarchaeum thermophilum]